MTEQSSCKSFFKEYLLYRIKSQRTNLFLCCILNMLALPLFVISRIEGFQRPYSDFYNIGKYFSIACGIFLIVLAVVGAVSSFELYNNKSLTDTIGALPLKYRQRFWGDFISGYIVNVAPVIPFGLISVMIFAGAQGKFKNYFGDVSFGAFQFMFFMALSLFLVLTFVYLFAVLILSSCGKAVHSVLFSIFGIAAVTGTIAGCAGCFAVGLLGADPSEYMRRTVAFCPPIGPLTDLIFGVDHLSGNHFRTPDGGRSGGSADIGDIFTAANGLYILYFVILAAGITLAAFYIGKRRRLEKTGSAFAVKPMFYALSFAMSAATVFIMTVLLADGHTGSGNKLITAAVAGVIACAVSIVMYLPKKKSLPECILCGMISVGVSVGLVALLRGTGSFGYAYLPENAKEIEYIRINDSFTLTDKSDIKKFVGAHNYILRSDRDNLVYGKTSNPIYTYSLEYQTADGRITKRSYVNTFKDSVEKMKNNERTLEGYGRYFFEALDNEDREWDCRIIEEDRTYDIPEQSIAEFIGTLRGEAAEKYDPKGKTYVRAEFSVGGYHTRSFFIGENYEKTIALLGKIRSTAEIDPNELILMIYYSDTSGQSIRINIRNKDMDDPLVKELIGLLKNGDFGAGDRDHAFDVNYKTVASSTSWDHYIPKEHSKRVLEIITELAFAELEA